MVLGSLQRPTMLQFIGWKERRWKHSRNKQWHLYVCIWADHKPVGRECRVSSEAWQWTDTSDFTDSTHYQLSTRRPLVHSARHWSVDLPQISSCNYIGFLSFLSMSLSPSTGSLSVFCFRLFQNKSLSSWVEQISFCHPASSVIALKETRNTDLSHWSGINLTVSTTRLLKRGLLVPLCRLSLLYYAHTHPFNGPFSGTTQVSRYQKGKTNLDFTEARDSEWQWHHLDHMQVHTSLQTDSHASTPPLSFFTGRMPLLPPNQQCQSTEGIKHWSTPVLVVFVMCRLLHKLWACFCRSA